MASEQFENLVRTGDLKTEAASQAELDGLIHSATARLKDAESKATISGFPMP